MMLPHTALNLRESKRNQLKDFVSVAGPLGVSHFMILTATDAASYLRVAKTPRVGGPKWGGRVGGGVGACGAGDVAGRAATDAASCLRIAKTPRVRGARGWGDGWGAGSQPCGPMREAAARG
jgi:hypothetical protein